MNLPISRRSLFLCLVVAGVLIPPVAPAAPAWWATRGVVSGTAEDYAILNLGQLKNMAAKACAEFNATLPGGADTAINNLVTGWNTTSGADDYAVCTLGQLKAVAKLFWDRLIATGYATTGEVPWTVSTSDDDDYSLANLGQLKQAFTVGVDRDGDDFPDNWEIATAGSLALLSGDGVHDQDGDSVSDLAEYQIGWNPLTNDLSDTAKTETLTYDAAHRLTGVSGRSALGYTPDANSNLTQAN